MDNLNIYSLIVKVEPLVYGIADYGDVAMAIRVTIKSSVGVDIMVK